MCTDHTHRWFLYRADTQARSHDWIVDLSLNVLQVRRDWYGFVTYFFCTALLGTLDRARFCGPASFLCLDPCLGRCILVYLIASVPWPMFGPLHTCLSDCVSALTHVWAVAYLFIWLRQCLDRWLKQHWPWHAHSVSSLEECAIAPSVSIITVWVVSSKLQCVCKHVLGPARVFFQREQRSTLCLLCTCAACHAQWGAILSVGHMQAAWLISFASFLPFRSVYMALRGMAPHTSTPLNALKPVSMMKWWLLDTWHWGVSPLFWYLTNGLANTKHATAMFQNLLGPCFDFLVAACFFVPLRALTIILPAV